jgi:hypothetical protein
MLHRMIMRPYISKGFIIALWPISRYKPYTSLEKLRKDLRKMARLLGCCNLMMEAVQQAPLKSQYLPDCMVLHPRRQPPHILSFTEWDSNCTLSNNNSDALLWTKLVQPNNPCETFLYLQAVNGGIVMVSFFNNFLSCTDTATLHDVIGMSEHGLIHQFLFLRIQSDVCDYILSYHLLFSLVHFINVVF